MAEVEAEPPVEGPSPGVEEAPAQPPSQEPPTYNEEDLIKVKGRVVKPTRPDDTERNEQVGKLQEEIAKHSERIKAIKEQLDARSGKGQAQTGPGAELRQQLGALRAEFSDTVRAKQRLQVENNDLKTERETLLGEVRTLRDGVRGPMNLEALNQRIADLEFRLSHESFSIAEEKKLRDEKERMERNDRPAVTRYAAAQVRLDAVKVAREALRTRLEEEEAKIQANKAQQDEVQAQLEALRARDAEGRSDWQALLVEKQEAYEIIVALRAKIAEIRADFDARWKEFVRRDRAYRAWSYLDRQRRRDERQREYEARQKARQEAQVAAQPNKYADQIFTCDQVLSYLRQYVATDEEAPATAASEAAQAPAPGMKLLVRDEAEDLGGLFGKGTKKGKGAKREALKAAAADSKGSKKLHHSLDSLKTFMTLGVDAPNFVSEVPDALAKLDAKRAALVEAQTRAAVASPDEAGAEEEQPEDEDVPPEEAPPEPASSHADDAAVDLNGHGPAEAAPPVAQGVWAAKSASKAASVGAPPAAQVVGAGSALLGITLKVTDDGSGVTLLLDVAS